MTKSPNHSLEARLTAATKALSGQREIHFVHAANQFPEGLERTTTIMLPPLPDAGLAPIPKPVDPIALAELRGEADLAALLLRHHAPQMHANLRPGNPMTALLFDRLEQVRVEALAATRMEGARANLQARLYKQLEQRPDLQGQDTLPILEAAPLILRSLLSEIPPPPEMLPRLESWKTALENIFGAHEGALRDALAKQSSFAKLSHRLMQELAAFDPNLKDVTLTDGDSMGEAVPTAVDSSVQPPEDDDNEDAMELPSGFGESESGEEEPGEEDQAQAESQAEGAEASEAGQQKKRLADALPDLPNMPPIHVISEPDAYHIYTDEYDEVTSAEKLSNPEELARLRKQLDVRLAPMQGVASKLAAKLQRLLLAQQQRHWEIEQEEGELNSAQLSRIITDPNYLTPYKRERVSDLRDTVIGLLIDNSGSMRGRPITLAAMSAEAISPACHPLAADLQCRRVCESRSGRKKKEKRRRGEEEKTPDTRYEKNPCQLSTINYQLLPLPLFLPGKWRGAQRHPRYARQCMQRAIGLARQELQAEPNYVLARLNLAYLHFTAGQAAEGEKELRTVAEHLAAPLEAWQMQGVMFPRNFQWFDVILERIYGEHAPESATWRAEMQPLLACRVHLSLAEITLACGQFTESARHAETAVQTMPHIGETHYARARALHALGQIDEALTAYRQTLAFAPFHVEAREQLARLCLDAERASQALGELEDWLAILNGCPVYANLIPATQTLRRQAQAMLRRETGAGVAGENGVRRLLALPDWNRPADWQAVVRAFAIAYAPEDPVLLLLRADPAMHPDAQGLLSQLERFLRHTLSIAADRLPNITLVNQPLPPADCWKLLHIAHALIADHLPVFWRELAQARCLPILSIEAIKPDTAANERE